MSNEYAETGFYTNKKEKSTGSICCSFLCSHVGLFMVVAVYAVAGAYIFIEIERPNELQMYEKKQQRAVQVKETKEYVAGLMWSYQHIKWPDSYYHERVTLALNGLERHILISVSDYKYDGTEKGWVDSWTVPKSLLLTMTIMSTIGYGHIYPETAEGKIFCIFYALIGCPLLLIFLGNLGNSIAETFIFIYSRICCRWCRSRRIEEELPPHASKKQRKLLVDDEVGKEEFMPTEFLNVPIVINLVLLMVYIILGAVLFSFWEGWNLTSSSYFTFITLSTIGYGDMVPGNAILADGDGNGSMQMLICIIYIVLGMALLSTCINLMQEQLLEKCHWLAKEIGLSKSENDGKDKNKTENSKNKQTKKKNQPSTIPEEGEQSPAPPAAALRSSSAGTLRSRRLSQDGGPSPSAESTTLAPPQTLAPIQSDSHSPSPLPTRSNCSTPIPGSLDGPD
ncbi:TWiK family of potassium channels protein 7-like [Portunus trituberculatus]|uniref:TWiK family of potassium channels protein 7-like n=1 Tax=Portunus trituberculatus TaxID=210409 RepID=UPI001E1D19E1|nr:TWiK family of potassium channels protein 7-like [Portunus trituberculatus]